jgi:hypothetical protein
MSDMNDERRIPGRRIPIPPVDPAHDRAQPGDVLGIESDGEVTHLGDDREDEDERLKDAEEALREKRGGPGASRP